VTAAITRAIALKSTYNIRVINLSLGRPVYTGYAKDPLCMAVESAWKAGIVVGVAAGNDGRDNTQGTGGYATINAPANDSYVITVGAMNTLGTLSAADDKITSYSSKGPTLLDHIAKPDLVAPAIASGLSRRGTAAW
jgi:serine protease AprX